MTREVTADLARRIGWEVIWFRHKLAHPQLMTVSASGPAAGGVGILGLARHQQAEPTTRDQLEELVLRTLRERFDPTVALDDEGDAFLVRDEVGLWIGVTCGHPVVRLWAGVVPAVHDRRQGAIEINILNREYMHARWLLLQDTVYQEIRLDGQSIDADQLERMVKVFVGNHRATRDVLNERVGGSAVQ